MEWTSNGPGSSIEGGLVRGGRSLYSGKDPFLTKLRAKIQKAKKIKLEARNLERKAEVLLGKTKEELVEKDLAVKAPAGLVDQLFDLEGGVAAIIDLTVDEIKHQGYARAPDYEIITHIALDDNPYFSRTFQFFDSEDVVGVLFRAPFMIILLGIIGTFAGFYLALNEGGDIKSGASVAIVSSLVGLPVSLLMDYINTLFPDESRYRQAFDKYKVTLEMLFNHEQELDTEQAEGETAKLKEEKELALAEAEQERLDGLAKQEAELGKQKQLEVAKTEQKLKEHAEREAAQLKKEHKLLAKLEQERVDALAKKEQAEGETAKVKKEKELALAKAEKEQVDAVAKKEAELDKQKQLEVAKTEQKLKEHAESEATNLKKENELLAKAEKAEREAAQLKEEKEQALAKAEQERLDALAKQEAEHEKQKQLELAKTEQKLKEQAEREAAKLKKEKEHALAEAALEHKGDLAAIIHKFGVSVYFLRKFRAESVFRCDYKASKLVEPNRDEARAPSGNSSARRGLYICVGAGSQGTVRWDTDGASVMRRAFVRDKTMPGAPRCDEKFPEPGHRF